MRLSCSVDICRILMEVVWLGYSSLRAVSILHCMVHCTSQNIAKETVHAALCSVNWKGHSAFCKISPFLSHGSPNFSLASQTTLDNAISTKYMDASYQVHVGCHAMLLCSSHNQFGECPILAAALRLGKCKPKHLATSLLEFSQTQSPSL